MFTKYHTKGLVIAGQIEDHDSRRITIFTEDLGLVRSKVQGGRSLASKLRVGAQDFSFGEFSLICGKGGWKIVSIRPEKNFFEILKGRPGRLKMMANVLNLIKKIMAEEKSEPEIFKIILNFLNFLTSDVSAGNLGQTTQNLNEDQLAVAECLTLTRILHCLGFMRHDPELLIPISSVEIEIKDLEKIAPRRSKMIALINESLKAA
jgi:recombinational DNA repair protein (RecF pathway)